MTQLHLVPPIPPERSRDLELALLHARGKPELAAIAARLWAALRAKGPAR